jgi:MFS family permease
MPLPAVLREERQFRLLFAGQALSVLGDRITFVAMPFAVLAAGGDVGDVGLVVAASTLPFALFALLAGVWADRLPRRRIMIASDLVRMLCQAAAGILLISGAAEPWHLAVLAFPYGAADAFFSPSMAGLMPQVVPQHHLQSANALRGFTMSSGMVLGPAIAGALVALAGPGTALLADAATFAVSILCLIPLKPTVVARGAEVAENMLAGLKGGLREVRARPWIAWFLGAMAAYHLIVLPSVFVLGPVLAQDELGGAESWAVITVGFGVGSIVGNLLMLRWKPDRALLFAALLMIGGSCQAAIIGSGLPVLAIAGLEAAAGVCVSGFFTLWETSLQEHVPEHALSRVSSMDYFASAGVMPLGAALAGPVAQAVGLKLTMLGMSVVGIAAALLCLSAASVRSVRRPHAALP